MALTKKSSPPQTVIVNRDYPILPPGEEAAQREKWWLDTRKVLLDQADLLQKLANDLANSANDATSANASRFAAIETRLTALEAVTQADLIRDAQVHPQAAIKESKIKLNFPTHSPANDPSTDQKQAMDNSNSPNAANPFVTLSQLNSQSGSSSVPAGVVLAHAGTVPSGWLECDGSALVRTAYPALYAAIGTTFGAPSGTEFNLPDLRGRTIIGVGTGSGLTARALADQVGAETHILAQSELPDPLTLAVETNNFDNGSPVGGTTRILADVEYGEGQITVSADFQNTGGDQPHNNMQPSLALRWIIRAF